MVYLSDFDGASHGKPEDSDAAVSLFCTSASRTPSRISTLTLLLLLGSVIASFPAAAASTLQITEFMAINDETLIDDDDDRSDWIEIHNPTTSPVNLSGWYLTDTTSDFQKWPFPNLTLYPNGYLVVFASEKDRRNLGAPLHTNFRLTGEGKYLALVHPDSGELSQFSPTYPRQQADVSYGLGREAVAESVLVPLGAAARAWIPTDDGYGLSWTEVGFDDSTWLSGTTGVGYDYGNLVGLDVAAMQGVNESVYIRIPFEIDELQEFDWLILRLQFEDGMIAYLNGHKIASDRDPDSPTWNSGATDVRDDGTAVSFIDIDISSAKDLLQEDENVLAFHSLNYRVSSSDLLLRPELVAVVQPEGPEASGYLQSPTPGLPNSPSVPHVAGEVRFSVASRTFTNAFSLALALPEDASNDAEIRYTTDGSVPNRSSNLYASPFTISMTTQVRARVFEPEGGEGPTVSETYVALNSDVMSFTSNLPLVLLETFGGGSIPQSSKQPAFLAIFEQGDGRSSLVNAPDLATRAGIKIRGSSTAGRPKPSLGIETWNEADDDKNISPLGMPAESDWVLWGPYNFDLALMRNPLIYELSNQVGRYAVRTRFVEVFLNTGGGSLGYADYFGVYALMEKISRDEDRVDVERLFPEHDRDPGVNGGYMLKIDRADPGDSGFGAAGQTLLYVYPKEVEMEKPERDPQEQYIRGFFNSFGTALNGPNYTDPNVGYAKYIDVDSWVDHHLLNVIAFNVDAFRLSTYMFKKRTGKLEMGAIWDFDRAMGSTDGRDINPWVWRASSGDWGTDFFNYPWWGRMFTDIDFFQRYIDRWQELRKAAFSTSNIHSVIDGMADELREAQVRDLQKWQQWPRSQYGGTYQGEIDHLKNWFTERIAFMESQFVSPPLMSSDGGQIVPGFTLTLWAPAGVVYYTLDGSDPRAAGGGVSASAIEYNGAISLTDTTVVRARALNENHVSLTGPNNPPLRSYWSGVSKARFSLHAGAQAGTLVITEINYHPLRPTAEEQIVNPNFDREDFEFIELRNIGAAILDLTGVQFTNGITFSFTDSDVVLLDPGERVLVVKNEEAFMARYGDVDNVAGVYEGFLDNSGEHLRLEDATGEVILDFTYEDEWHPLTDGFGFSLVILNEGAAGNTWGERESWRASTAVGGSPGLDDAPPLGIPTVLISEALTHTVLPEKDAIELYNPTAAGVDIGGWFLTDERGDPKKFRIPDGTLIPAGEYMVFDEDDFDPTPPAPLGGFGLSSRGEEVYLFSADIAENLTGYLHGFRFGAADSGVPFGRHVISTGEEHFVAQEAASFGNVNAGPRVGPVVINEIMYAPPSFGGVTNTKDEYIELRNISASPVALFDPDDPAQTWRLGGGVEFVFPEDLTLPPGGLVVVVSFDPMTDPLSLMGFLGTYNLAFGEPLAGPYMGRLENSGEGIELLRPAAVEETEDPGGEEVAYVVVDRVEYSNGNPWPEDAEETGNSLQRLVGEGYGNDPLNWQAAAPTPDRENAEGGNPDVDDDGLPNHWESAKGLDPRIGTGDHGGSGDPDGDGSTNEEECVAGTHPLDASSLLEIRAIEANAGSLVLRFTVVAGKSYSVLYREVFSGGPWLKLKDIGPQLETGILEIDDPDATGVMQRFYRIVTPGQAE
jgi:hypothetical protein